VEETTTFEEDWSVKTALEITTSQLIDPKIFQGYLKYYIHVVGQQNQNDFIHENKSKQILLLNST
jgi:hypothetical protein